MTEREQNLSNHTQWTPAYHFLTVPVYLFYLGWAVRRAVSHPGLDAWFALVGAVAIVLVGTVSRMQVLKVQDRVIRLEERLRLTQILPPELQPSIRSLRASHLIALRFASDEEVPGLVREVLANPSMSQKDIKQRIRHWRADWFRA